MRAARTLRDAARTMAKAALLAPIHGYRLFLSPLLGPACRFEPSCSAYALEAIRLHGPARGLLMAARRLTKCRPGGGSGFDPVPPLARHALSDVETLGGPGAGPDHTARATDGSTR